MSIRGQLLRVSYQLDHHYGGALSIGRWIVVIGAALALLGLLPRVRLAPALAVPAGVIALLTLALLIWGRALHYYHFVPGGPATRPAEPAPLRGLDHIEIRASGKFSVEGREQFFADLQAIYHTFETREHAVMAFVPFSRFLLGGSRTEHRGMWYIFWKPAQIISMQIGTLEHGRQARPAICVAYSGEKKPETACLAFDSEQEMQKAAADLWYDVEAQST
jgi:hypothetical protein